MATNHTEHYNLSQWVKTDPVLMSDFNDDNAKLDAALYKLSQPAVVAGSYTGNGTSSQKIELGFRPTFLVVMRSSAEERGGHFTYFGDPQMYFTGSYNNTGAYSVGCPFQFNDTGFTVTGATDLELNAASRVFRYFAFR